MLCSTFIYRIYSKTSRTSGSKSTCIEKGSGPKWSIIIDICIISWRIFVLGIYDIDGGFFHLVFIYSRTCFYTSARKKSATCKKETNILFLNLDITTFSNNDDVDCSFQAA